MPASPERETAGPAVAALCADAVALRSGRARLLVRALEDEDVAESKAGWAPVAEPGGVEPVDHLLQAPRRHAGVGLRELGRPPQQQPQPLLLDRADQPRHVRLAGHQHARLSLPPVLEPGRRTAAVTGAAEHPPQPPL